MFAIGKCLYSVTGLVGNTDKLQLNLSCPFVKWLGVYCLTHVPLCVFVCVCVRACVCVYMCRTLCAFVCVCLTK